MSVRSITWCNGLWHEGDPAIITPRTVGFAMSATVFDGARLFEGVAPDLEPHCGRCIDSARVLRLKPMLTKGEMAEIAWDGIHRFPSGSELYIKPCFYAEDGFVLPVPESTRFVMTLYEAPMPQPTGLSACVSSYRRPVPGTAPTMAKASALYPNTALAMWEAKEQGFDNCIVLDVLGHVSEFATANLFLVKEGAVHTPVWNGTFLNGITRQRVISLLRAKGVDVHERVISVEEVLEADEVFSTGNYGKVQPFTRIAERDLQPGPVYRLARELYWDFAHSKAA